MGDEKITLAHGSGGKMMHQLIDSVFISRFRNAAFKEKNDSAIAVLGSKKIAFTTDTYVVDPVFFPGGDIGSLAVNGTVNDISVSGARPVLVSLAVVIEEGFPKSALDRIAGSIAASAGKAGVSVVTGDTKVVGRGACDKIFINTSGIGEVCYHGLSAANMKDGDSVIVSGPVGDHAISVLSRRESMDFKTPVRSDSATLNRLILGMLRSSKKIRIMRDPTRGGLATTLNEFVNGTKLGICIDESSVPVREGVRQACEMLGFDPLYLACEGRVVAVVAAEDEDKVIAAMRRDAGGKRSVRIGRVVSGLKGMVCLDTAAGGRRSLDMLSGEQLPRIC